MDSLERGLAFWIQFAEIWKSLADISHSSQRADFLAKAATCLRKAQDIKEKVRPQPLDSRPSVSFSNPHPAQHDQGNRAF
jgi:hypothetical protein